MYLVKGVENKRLTKCRAKAKESRAMDLIGKLHVDMMFQEKYLPSGVSVKVWLVRSSDVFVLMANGPNPQYKLKLNQVTL